MIDILTGNRQIIADSAAYGRHIARRKSADQERDESPQGHVDTGLARCVGRARLATSTAFSSAIFAWSTTSDTRFSASA